MNTTYRDPLEDPTTIFEAQGHRPSADVAPVLYTYAVEYITASERIGHVTVTALDAVDAKHLAESLEGEVILTARARRVGPAL